MFRNSLFIVALAFSCAAWAYPTKPVRFIVPFTPGGGADLVGRVVGQKLTEQWGQQVIVDNRPGAGTNLAAELAAAATPDGYTIYQFNAANVIAPSVYKKLSYDPIKDFTAVTQLASSPFVLTAYAGIKAKTVQELIAVARAEPAKLSYASSGIGGTSHLLGELLKAMSKTDIVHVPYKGAVPGLNDLMSGRVHLMFVVPATALPHVKAGRVRALGMSSAKRSPLAPDMPTIAESGLAGFEGTAWYGVVAPARTPREIVAKLSRDFRHVLQQPDVRERLIPQGVEVVGSTPDEFSQFMRSEMLKWRQVATAAGISPE